MNDDQLRKILNEELAKFAGQIFRHVDERIDDLHDELRGDIGRVHTAVDGLAKRIATDDDERAAMNHQLDRHERWHHQTADHLGMKLDY